MRSPLHLLSKESTSPFLEVLIPSIFHWMLVDSEMNACTSHVISAKDIINPRPTGGNIGGWYLTDLA
jgi:hypothetical protein